jgi:hypothetical protein
MPDPRRNTTRYRGLRSADKSGRGHTGSVGFKPEGQYSAGAAPRVGGAVKPATPLASATRSQLRSAKRTRRRIGTGRSATQPRY